MGTEIIPFVIWFLGAIGIFAVVLRMIATRRWLAAAIAFTLSLAAYVPFYFILGWNMFPILHAELALALVIGTPALVYSRRWLILILSLSAALIPTMVFLLPGISLEDTALRILTIPIFVWVFTLLSAPVCVALASVFFVGAFIESRPYRTSLCNPS